MKIYLGIPFMGVPQFGEHYKKIYDEIEKLGYEHVDKEIINLTYVEWQKKMEKGRDSYVDHYQKKMKAIKEADICIFEASFHSLGIGFLIQKALENSKPTIALYYEDKVPYFLSGAEDEKLLVRSYNDKNYKKTVQEVLDFARERRDKRFNFFLSPRLLDYLEQASKKEGVTKSKLIRDLIVDHMRNENKSGGFE